MLSGNGLAGTQAAGRLRRFLRRLAGGLVGRLRKGFLALFFFLFQFAVFYLNFLHLLIDLIHLLRWYFFYRQPPPQ